jgi:phosphotransferase system  glucose/maltose/N-acetylglucosamine-specific IIC component
MSPRFKNTFLANLVRAMIEIGSILFLFYSNLLMGEYTHSNSLPGKTLSMAINDIFTLTNFIIGNIAAIIGYFVFEFLRRKFR